MAHFAELNNENKVIRVIVVNNAELLDANGIERERLGIIFCKDLLGGGKWVQTSYNETFRKNYAGADYFYDEERNAFIPPKPFPSWLLNETTCRWDSPVPCPTDDNYYDWDENSKKWVLRADNK